jgi:phosphohistidine phosphatase
MHLYLVRHGDAANIDSADPAKALSPRGKEEVVRMSAHLSALNVPVDLIVHSPKARAKQTALVFSEQLKPKKGVLESADLHPLDDPMIWSERLNKVTHNLMLVGHMPYMGKLTSLLACGFADAGAFTFAPATVACLTRDDTGMWSVVWMMGPGLLRNT